MLELKNVNIKYNNFSLQDISFTVADNEYYALIGPSGSGKTLILNIIAGITKPKSGTIILNNVDITHKSIKDRNIAYLFQDLALFPHLNVYDNIAFPLKIRKIHKSIIKEKVLNILDFIEAKDLINRNIDNLSGGEKQRVALARALINESKLLILDEPFSAIDTQLKYNLKKLLKKINKAGISIIHVTHDPEEILNLANKIIVIENGKIIKDDKLELVFNKPSSLFIANFLGKKNYFNYQVINEEDKIVKIFTTKHNENHILIKAKNISYTNKTLNLPITSINISEHENQVNKEHNIFKGIITNIISNEYYSDIEIQIDGFSLWTRINTDKFNCFNLYEDKEIIIYFSIDAAIN